MIITDTNLVSALVLNSERTDLAMAVWEKDPDWYAPEIWQSEFRNVLVKLMRAKVIGLDTAERAFGHARAFVETLPAGTGAVLRYCEEYPLTAYDAEFAAIAEYLGAELISFDEDLTGCGLALTPEAFLERPTTRSST